MSVFVGDWVKSRTFCMHATEPPIINRGSVIVLGCRCFIGAIARTDAASRLLPEELEAMIRAGGFDKFGQTRTRQFWEAQYRIAPLVVTNAIRAGCCRRRRWKSFPRCHCGSRRVASGSKAK